MSFIEGDSRSFSHSNVLPFEMIEEVLESAEWKNDELVLLYAGQRRLSFKDHSGQFHIAPRDINDSVAVSKRRLLIATSEKN